MEAEAHGWMGEVLPPPNSCKISISVQTVFPCAQETLKFWVCQEEPCLSPHSHKKHSGKWTDFFIVFPGTARITRVFVFFCWILNLQCSCWLSGMMFCFVVDVLFVLRCSLPTACSPFSLRKKEGLTHTSAPICLRWVAQAGRH